MLLLWRQKPVRASHAPVAFLSSTVLHLKFEGWRYLLKLNIELQKLMVIVSSESVAPEQSIENRSKNMFQFLKLTYFAVSYNLPSLKFRYTTPS